jgi:hypothetical protein
VAAAGLGLWYLTKQADLSRAYFSEFSKCCRDLLLFIFVVWVMLTSGPDKSAMALQLLLFFDWYKRAFIHPVRGFPIRKFYFEHLKFDRPFDDPDLCVFFQSNNPPVIDKRIKFCPIHLLVFNPLIQIIGGGAGQEPVPGEKAFFDLSGIRSMPENRQKELQNNKKS